METGRWKYIRHLLEEAMDLAASERERFLDELRERDPSAAEEVRSLLAGDTMSLDFEPPVHADWVQSLAAECGSGERLGAYELREPIASGGMGQVWRAVRADEEFEKEVAIKLVKRGMDSDEILRRFRLERQVLAGLEHPGIARLIDGGVSPTGQPWLVMELVDGVPIDQYCDRERLSTADRLRLVQEVCEAVHYAHQHLVVHRDIKPNNVLVTSEGRIKLLDFGVAKVLSDEPPEGEATVPGGAWLTPEYASPEQLAGHPLTTVSDVYSLGVLLYRLLTGRRPHELTGRPRHQLERIVLEEQPQRPSEVVTKTQHEGDGEATDLTPEELAHRRRTSPSLLRGTLAGDLDNIVLQALAKEPARRYSTAKELAEDIERHLSGLPVLARSGDWLYRSRKFLRRNRLPVALGGLALAALVAGLVVSTTWYLRAAEASRRAERRFDEVRGLAKVFLFDVDRELESGLGPTAARQRIASTALDYLERLAGESTRDPRLALELADGYLRLGDLQGGLGSESLGQLEAARRSHGRAREMLAALPPDDWTPKAHLIELHLDVRDGDAAMQAGRNAEALGQYRLANERLGQLRAELSRSPLLSTDEWLSARHEVESRLATQLEIEGHLEEAIEHRRLELEAARAWAALGTRAEDASAANESRGPLASASGEGAIARPARSGETPAAAGNSSASNGAASLDGTNPAAAMQATDASDANGASDAKGMTDGTHTTRLANDEGAGAVNASAPDAIGRHVLARSLDDLANALERLAMTGATDHTRELDEEAAALREESYQLMRSAFDSHPGDRRARMALGAALHTRGRQHLSARRLEAGLECLREALEHFRWLAATDPGSATNRRNLSIVLTEIGYAYSMLDDPDEALRHHREALGLKEELYAAEPDNAFAHRGLAIARRATAELLIRLDRLNEALELIDLAHEDFEQLLERSPDQGEARIDMIVADAILSGVRRSLARRAHTPLDERFEHAEAARDGYERALRRLDELEASGLHAPGQEQLRVPLEKDLGETEELLLRLDREADAGS